MPQSDVKNDSMTVYNRAAAIAYAHLYSLPQKRRVIFLYIDEALA